MYLAKKWPEMIVKWSNAKVVLFISNQSLYLKWLLGADQDLVLTFSNPFLKSPLQWTIKAEG